MMMVIVKCGDQEMESARVQRSRPRVLWSLICFSYSQSVPWLLANHDSDPRYPHPKGLPYHSPIFSLSIISLAFSW
jgi:hypothetical protein